MTVTVADAQARLPELIAGLQPGEAVIITDNDRPVARLVVEEPPKREPRKLGTLKGTVLYADVQVGLPFHHRDPFDRLLVAQALSESVPVVSSDAQFDAYGVTRVW